MVAGIALLLVIGLLVANHFWLNSARTSANRSETRPSEASPPSFDEASPEVSAAANPSSSSQVTLHPPPSRTRNLPPPPHSGSGPPAEQLLAQLTLVDLSTGALIAAQAQQLKRNLQQLVAQGTTALPTIRSFLETNEDISFGDTGSQLVGVPTLRAGLIDALGQIGGPEVLELSRELLKTTSNPLDIALLARNLEQAAPGQYTQDTLDAARQALAQAAAGKLDLKDPAPLFQVLQTYGDASVAADLTKLVPNWNYYATMALAGLPAGQGIPYLVQLAQTIPADPAQYNKLPLQMLAQLSAQYPDASSALLDMARQNQIPDNAWRAVAAGLGGNQYQFRRQLPQNTFPPGSGAEAGSTVVGGPSETFYSTPLPTDPSAANISQRLALIDQLLAANANNPAAVAALNQARARLSVPR